MTDSLVADSLVLAVETSVLAASAALVDSSQRQVARWDQPEGLRGSAQLAPGVSGLLEQAGVGVADLAGIAVGVGPGSYTGLRVGVAFARALAWAAGRPVAGVPSLAAAARAELARDDALRSVIALVDARRGEVYRADYARAPDGGLIELLAARLVAEAEAEHPALPGLAGEHDVAALCVIREPRPDAYHVAVLARERLAAGGDVPDEVLPLYLKRSHAEIALDERRGA